MRKIFLFVLALFILSGCTGVDKTEELQQKLVEYERENELLQEKVSVLQASVDSLVQVTSNIEDTVNYWFDGLAASRILDLNVESTDKFIRNALRDRTDLIPLKPVLGGTMRFLKVQLLGEKWIIADYEDGHIRGRSIFEYQSKKDGKISFKRIASSSE